MRNRLWEVKQLFLHHIRLLLYGKETWILLTVGIVMLLAMLLGMDDVKEEKSKITVGIADEDTSEFSARVIDRMKELDGYEIIEGQTAELLDGLTQGELSVVCVIREGYESNVLRGKNDDLVLIYETNQKQLLFTDVLAGAMIQEICSAKSYRLFKEYVEKRDGVCLETQEEFSAYLERYFDNDMFDFSFATEYVSVSGEESRKPGNEIIYLQAILAIAAMMMGILAVYATMPYHRLCHGAVADKMATLPYGKGTRLCASFLGCLALTGIFALVFLTLFTIRNRLTFLTFTAFLVCTFAYLCVIVGIVLLGATYLRSQQVYQIGMTALILVCSVFGLVSIIDGLLLPEGISTWVPNAHYVREMMKLYQN